MYQDQLVNYVKLKQIFLCIFFCPPPAVICFCSAHLFTLILLIVQKLRVTFLCIASKLCANLKEEDKKNRNDI